MNKRDSEFINAASIGDLDAVKRGFEQGADMHADDDLALLWAADSGHTDVVEYLKRLGKGRENE